MARMRPQGCAWLNRNQSSRLSTVVAGRALSASHMPHPLALLLACVVIAASLSYVLPAGEYERRPDTTTGRKVVVPGSFHAVEARPVAPFAMLVAVPRGMIDAGS